MKHFFEEHPHEVAILDMNHFYNMEPSDHDRLLGEIVGTINDLLVPVNGYQYKLNTLTLADVWNNPGRIILIYHNPFNAANFPNIWNRTVIQSPWPNTNNVGALMTYLDTKYADQTRPPGCGFYVWQGCITPSGCTIFKNCCSSLRGIACEATEAFVSWLIKDKASGDKGINICMVDFVEMADFIPAVLALNKLDTKETKEDVYGSIKKGV